MPYPVQDTCAGCDPNFPGVLEYTNPTPVYYARIIPLSGTQLLPSPSNPVLIEYKILESGNVAVVDPIPPIYDVQINSVKAPIPPSSHWGCVDIIAINPDSWVWTATGSWFKGRLDEFKGYLNNQQPYCPARYAKEDKAWYEVLWDSVNDALSFINVVYQKCKEISVKSLMLQADIVEFDKLCPKCFALTEKVLAKGQEKVLMSLYGAPAEIPNLDQLTDQGIELLVEKSFEYAGVNPDDCNFESGSCLASKESDS